jgi:hypothetical protein
MKHLRNPQQQAMPPGRPSFPTAAAFSTTRPLPRNALSSPYFISCTVLYVSYVLSPKSPTNPGQNGMRKGYWALHSAMEKGIMLGEHDMPEMSSPKHFMHCTDLIRQVLMCQPDLTLEKKIEAVGGVAGFGTEHVCKNWGDLTHFVEIWQDWGRS